MIVYETPFLKERCGVFSFSWILITYLIFTKLCDQGICNRYNSYKFQNKNVTSQLRLMHHFLYAYRAKKI